jgi:phage repressor protein C with HTH and peptisase S24 domain
MNTPEILGYSNFPELRGSKYVVRGKGNSMAPFICDGDFVGIRPVKNRNIIDYGNPYGIITEDYAIFKRIKKAKDAQNLKLVSDNDKEHEDWEVPKGEIIHLFIVVGVLSVKSVTY